MYEYIPKNGKIRKLPSKCTDIPLSKGDIIRVYTPGSGGYGDPYKRDVKKVLADVIESKVSIEKAKEDYGVIIEKVNENFVVNNTKTKELREKC